MVDDDSPGKSLSGVKRHPSDALARFKKKKQGQTLHFNAETCECRLTTTVGVHAAVGQYSRRSVDTAGDRPPIAVLVLFLVRSYGTLGNLDHLPSSQPRCAPVVIMARLFFLFFFCFFFFFKQKKAAGIAERESLKKNGVTYFFEFLMMENVVVRASQFLWFHQAPS